MHGLDLVFVFKESGIAQVKFVNNRLILNLRFWSLLSNRVELHACALECKIEDTMTRFAFAFGFVKVCVATIE